MQSLEAHSTAVAIPAGHLHLHGRLQLPTAATGLVLFALGGGNSDQSPGNQRVADALHDVGLGTLLCDLLPEAHASADSFQGGLRSDVGLLAERLRRATRWVREQPELSDLPVGYFGGGQGAAAALLAAAAHGDEIQAVVTSGARPHLAPFAVRDLRVPTLLIVGGNDAAASDNLEAWARLRCEKAVEIIPGAGPRFEEPGALDNVAALAARWFGERLRKEATLVA